LSFQKNKNGILPTLDSALKTGFRLRTQMRGWGGKQAVSGPDLVFAFVFLA